jgi:hypothetical protein
MEDLAIVGFHLMLWALIMKRGFER